MSARNRIVLASLGWLFSVFAVFPVLAVFAGMPAGLAIAGPPHVVLVMADDQGWGQTGYRGHPCLPTPALDAMAEAGLRLDRFYAGSPVCSPTRAAVLTGRTPFRTGVYSHGYALRHQEITLAQRLREAGYVCGHFGKWHLNGLRGPGVPLLKEDPFHPGVFGFDTWLSTSNFFDRDPLLSRGGDFEAYQGDSSEIVVDQALKFLAERASQTQPTLTVIWFGTPHSPFVSDDQDRRPFANQSSSSANQHGELVAMDRAIGTLRKGLRDLKIADQTLLWFCSDNGGLRNIKPSTTGGLRGFKGQLYEGGIRVPAILEYPGKISAGTISQTPASVLDIFPTVLQLADLKPEASRPIDGISLVDWFDSPPPTRGKAIYVRYKDASTLIGDRWKIIAGTGKNKRAEFYDLQADPNETQDQRQRHPETFAAWSNQLATYNASVDASDRGKDYAEGVVDPEHPQPRFWDQVPGYAPHLDAFWQRPNYRKWGINSKRPFAIQRQEESTGKATVDP